MEELTPQQFVFETPLYQEIGWTGEESSELVDILFNTGTIDGPCIMCAKDSTYRRVDKIVQFDLFRNTGEIKTYWLNYTCSRNQQHRIVIYIAVFPEEKYFSKIGQFPSMASLHEGKLREYRKILSREKYEELSKGFGLAAHGIGIGSFVYLRRVFEDLIEEAHQFMLLDDNSWDETTYRKSRVGERIKMLANKLPTFLVQNSSLYGLLSKGVHELSENECKEFFPIIASGIELILDEKKRVVETEQKIKNAERAISQVQSKFGN